MGDKKSRTEKDSFVEERIFGDHHYKTTITDGQRKAVARGRIAEEAEKRASDKWDKGETSSAGCFITTACINSRGLPDDCEELNCFRLFRDDFVSKLPIGKELIREYYEVAVISQVNLPPLLKLNDHPFSQVN